MECSSQLFTKTLSLAPEQHGDAATHDVELAALMPDERQRVLGAIRQTVAMERVQSPAAGSSFSCRSALPRIALVARYTLSSVTLTHTSEIV